MRARWSTAHAFRASHSSVRPLDWWNYSRTDRSTGESGRASRSRRGLILLLVIVYVSFAVFWSGMVLPGLAMFFGGVFLFSRLGPSRLALTGPATRVRRQIADPPRCTDCNYDLGGLTENAGPARCPEYGVAWPLVPPATRSEINALLRDAGESSG
jgi:hypothetical protein